ncbi:Rne/Rng family ribonuclease [Acidipropionibacterium jensenii]|uniref:Rne/Rng family ribonuclease n=1 Tax=Acidipropionibacterium jensenii TaxID=1749 RepID=UPI00214CAE17|nr:Rne/Rng family ribonuclease [Acidipropionibacterium jensenii]
MLQDNTDNSTAGPGSEEGSEGVAPTTTRRRRRAASRPAGAPSATAATTTTPAITISAAGSGGSVISSETDASDLPRPPSGRRRRATRSAAAPVDKPAETPAVEAPVVETPNAEPQPEAAPAAKTRTPRRRRSIRPASQPVAEPVREEVASSDRGEDPVEAALSKAEKAGRKGAAALDAAVANPFSTADILDSLAAEIGGEEAAPKRTRRRRSRSAEKAEAAEETENREQPEDKAPAKAPEKTQAEEAPEAPAADTTPESDSDEDSEESRGTRRRRRRGGRRRRRGESSEDHEEETEDHQDSGGSEGSDKSEDSGKPADKSSDEESSSTRRRRRRRRRRGEDTSGAEDDPSDVVVKVREPRPHKSAADEVTGIEGSTRLEAKKQRRREGRAAGRRRSPILTEAEFLARREQVERRMVVRQSEDYSQLAVLEDGALVEHYVDRSSAASSIGNIYLGKVQNVLPSMEAAFVDIGRGRNAVLYAGEVDWARYGKEGEPKRIEHVLKSGDTVLVQVSKDPVGQKGARLTCHISIPGRYIVYAPGGQLSGISRKLADTERKRLKKIIDENIPSDASVIVRTAAEGASEEDLERDISRLKSQWEVIERKAKSSHAPVMLYTEPDLTLRIIRDLFTADFSELVVAGAGGPEDAYETIKGYIDHVAPDLGGRLTHWDTESQGDPFAQYRIDEQIAKALERKVFLPSGGSLVIDRTEAMTVIDVNTGKFTGSAGNLEATVTANNLEAAEEIVRQLRLRDIGGIIVTDFIDMVLPANRELLVRRLVECLGRDRTRHQVSEVTSLGLVQMTRKKIGTGLAEAFTEECQECGGRGYHRFTEPVDSQAPADGGERSGSDHSRSRSNRSRSGRHSGHGSKKSD